MFYVRNLGGCWYPDSKIKRAKNGCFWKRERKEAMKYLQSIKTDTIKKQDTEE